MKREPFANASEAFRLANPHIALPKTNKNSVQPNVVRGRGIMNQTETEFSCRLEAMKRNGEIIRYEFEGITLRWADMRYTPDFIVFQREVCLNSSEDFSVFQQACIKLIEIKGAHIWDRDRVRFKGARAYWPQFQFEMHQKKEGIWKRIM